MRCGVLYRKSAIGTFRATRQLNFLPRWRQTRLRRAPGKSTFLKLKDAGAAVLVLNPEYHALIARMYEHSESLVKTSDAAGDYAAAHQMALEVGLHLPQN
jgi:hypothetical protein